MVPWIYGHFLFFPFLPYIWMYGEVRSRKFREVSLLTDWTCRDFPLPPVFPIHFGMYGAREVQEIQGGPTREDPSPTQVPWISRYLPFPIHCLPPRKCMGKVGTGKVGHFASGKGRSGRKVAGFSLYKIHPHNLCRRIFSKQIS